MSLRRNAFLLIYVLTACAPYAKGPVFTEKNAINTFGPLTEFMGITKGMTIADVGAGSGALTVIMSTQLDSCTVYIQDIDRDILQEENVTRIIPYYDKEFVRKPENTFHVLYGTPTASNLPDGIFDVIYMNGVVHVLDSPNIIIQDLKGKLKTGGRIYIRDGFKNFNGEGEYCSSSKCGSRLLSVDEFKELMNQNGYLLISHIPDMDGYPIFGFSLR
jgi:SAM-dependent methyltransferase